MGSQHRPDASQTRNIQGTLLKCNIRCFERVREYEENEGLRKYFCSW